MSQPGDQYKSDLVQVVVLLVLSITILVSEYMLIR
jgi:hypothetical protein